MISNAVTVDGPTALADLQVSGRPRPEVSSGEVLVEVHAAGVNRSDVVNAQGFIPLTSFPCIPGRDFSGVVIEGPADLVGLEVWGTGGGDLGFVRHGSHAQHLVLAREALVVKPPTLSFDQAGSAGLTYLAAALAMERAGRVAAGSTVLVTGAVGGVGSAAAALARSRGATVIGAVSGDREAKLADEDGIDVVIDTRERDLVEAVQEATSGAGADIAVDTVGAPLLNDVIAAMGIDGGVCFLAAQGLAKVEFDPMSFYRRDLRLVGLNTTRTDTVGAAKVLRSLLPAFERGELGGPRIAAHFPLAEASKAYRLVDSGQATGRVVIRPQL